MKKDWSLIIIGSIILGIILPVQIQFLMSYIKPISFLEACGVMFIIVMIYTVYLNLTSKE